jgi:PilZ domain-containing protein
MKRPGKPKDGTSPPKAGGMLARANHARLRTASGEHWPVRVAGPEGEDLMLVLLVEPDPADPKRPKLKGKPADPLTLEFTSDYGVARFCGEVVLEERDLIRFRIRDAPEVVQRREFVRVRSPQPVVLAVTGTTTIGSAYAVDVSGGGMLLSGAETLLLNDKIRFRLHVDDESPPIKGRGRVVRVADGGQRALAFEQISQQDRERLIHFIFERQREARARTRDLPE